MSNFSTESFRVNQREYQLPDRPIVVICLDGTSEEYLSVAMSRGRLPHIQKMMAQGFYGSVRVALPSFTNVNNSCLATGVAPSVHGISGNFFLNPETGEEVMMNY